MGLPPPTGRHDRRTDAAAGTGVGPLEAAETSSTDGPSRGRSVNADIPDAGVKGRGAGVHLLRVELEDDNGPTLPAFLEADRAQAIADIASEARFIPVTLKPDQRGVTCLALRLSIRNGRLIFDIRDQADAPLTAVGLALGPFRRLIKDYHLLVDSHMKAVEEGRESRIQAIDMGRRGLHNEGASLMVRRLQGKITIDFETARRLFSLVCILHQRVSAR
jgi:uncharacterized protein (UPF0262 family)